MNKLNSNDIQYIKDNYENVNDYILKNSFDELKKTYNVNELQEKNKEIIKQNQQEMSEILQENITRDTSAGAEEQEGEEDEELKEAEEKEKKVKCKKKERR